jgi:glycosyltransferase involved in cell wall biosynthesis
MKILMVGNDPREFAGVANYTRPLSAEFVKMGHKVFYFSTGRCRWRYNWLLRPYLRIDRKEFPFELADLVNPPIWGLYHGDVLPEIHEERTERIFRRYVEAKKPDVIHIHSRFALPISIIEIGSELGIPVFNSIHVYGLICPKRVMIHADGRPCSGPSDLEKCVDCAEPVNVRKQKNVVRLHNTDKRLVEAIVKAKNRIRAPRTMEPRVSGGNAREHDKSRAAIREGLAKRLEYAVRLMNRHVSMNICVSSDVKKTLMKYGVREERLLVQHIGSAIAAQQTGNMHEVHDPLVIGNMGVGYYKGTQVLLEAVRLIKGRRFILKVFGRFDAAFVDEIIKDKRDLPIEFHGEYRPDDIPDILDRIDLMVLPSICSDTAPQTIFESYSAAIPIAASDIGGFPDFIQDGINGRLFKAGDCRALADVLASILDHPEDIRKFSGKIPKLKTLGENARELIFLYKSGSRESA